MNNSTKIIKYLTSAAENKVPLGPEDYMRAARSLVLFLGDERDKLIELETKLAQMTVDLKNENKDLSIAEVKLRRDAWPEYAETKRQKAKVDQIIEFIRVAKLQARLSYEEMRHQDMQ